MPPLLLREGGAAPPLPTHPPHPPDPPHPPTPPWQPVALPTALPLHPLPSLLTPRNQRYLDQVSGGLDTAGPGYRMPSLLLREGGEGVTADTVALQRAADARADEAVAQVCAC